MASSSDDDGGKVIFDSACTLPLILALTSLTTHRWCPCSILIVADLTGLPLLLPSGRRHHLSHPRPRLTELKGVELG